MAKNKKVRARAAHQQQQQPIVTGDAPVTAQAPQQTAQTDVDRLLSFFSALLAQLIASSLYTLVAAEVHTAAGTVSRCQHSN